MGVLDDAIREHLELKRRHGASDDELKRQEDEALSPVRREPRAAREPDEPELALDETEAALDQTATGERVASPGTSVREEVDDEALSDEVPAGERLDADEPDPSMAGAAPTEILGEGGSSELLDERLLDEEEYEEEELAEELAGGDAPALADDSAHDELLAADDELLATDDETFVAGEEELLAEDVEPAPHRDDLAAGEPGSRAEDEELVAEPQELAAAEETPMAEEDEVAAGPPPSPPSAGPEDEAITQEQPVPDEAQIRGSEPDIGAEDELEPPDEEEDVLEETPDFLQETPEDERLWFEQKPPRDFDLDR